MIGGEGVWDKLAGFVPIGEAMVIDELLRAWRKAEDPERYARTVLADADFGTMRLEVRGSHRVRCLRHMTNLTNVVCYGSFGPLEPLAAVPRLRQLELVQSDIRDLSPLARCPSLRCLAIKGGVFLTNLSPLADTAIEELGLYWNAADLHTLRAPKLQILHISDSRIAGCGAAGSRPGRAVRCGRPGGAGGECAVHTRRGDRGPCAGCCPTKWPTATAPSRPPARAPAARQPARRPRSARTPPP
jgi:hypothetical protein